MKNVKGLPRKENTLLSHVQLPVSKVKVTIRPFNVGHRKLFTLVKSSPSPAEIVDVIVTVADAVSGISTAELATADIEKIFIESRKLSSGSIIRKSYTCKNIVAVPDTDESESLTKTCDTDVHVEFDLKEAAITDHKNFTKLIDVHGTTLTMEFRDIQAKDYLLMQSTDIMDMYYIAKSLLVSVIDSQENTSYTDWTGEELNEFWDSLSPADLEKVLNDFILASPTHELHHTFRCPVCKYEANMNLKGIFSFF